MALDKKDLKRIFKEEHYKVKLFDENGFIRKQCPICKDYFWTLNPETEICGDTQCLGGYSFIDLKRKSDWDFHNTVKRWCDFFEKNGHKRIQEYPVVARWRPDLYFTIASIGCFQPYVLNGTVPPPANPLVIPQPCIRFGGKGFNDIDNVGKTGRHLTSFIMGGQHAFNSKKQGLKGYWMDRCIDLDFRFLTEVLKINPAEITLREDIWMGGGNFGPCLESFSKGLEIVNSVFMQYEILPDGSYRQMDMTVVDVGWGVERVGWFASGTLTVYEATFGPILENLKKSVSINIDADILEKYARISGLLNVDENERIDETRRRIAQQLGLSYDVMQEQLGPLEALYAITDHVRTLVFSIADGAFPSNVGGGYNLRMILRRAITLNELYNLNIDLVKLSYDTISYFKKTYTRLANANDIIEDILKTEFQRFTDSRKKGKKYVERLLKENKTIDTSKYLELYESRGIPPEVVKEIAQKQGKKVEIPSDFYVALGELKERSKKSEEEQPFEKQFKGRIDDVPGTKALYVKHDYDVDFEAKILKILDDRFIILDQTLFYPTSGGQLHDTGTIEGLEVDRVEKIGEVIIHQLAAPTKKIKMGQKVKAKIDWSRRIALMRNHTATHVVNAAARKVLGNHVWQGGAEKRPERAHLDISHYKAVSRDELRQIEQVANEIVLKNIPINKTELIRTEAEQTYGFGIYQGGAVPGKMLRIVNIDGTDVEACGGTHLNRTGEIGFIKMLGARRIQDGVVRLEYAAGMSAILQIQKMERLLETTADIFKIGKTEVPEKVKNIQGEWKRLIKENERLQKELFGVLAKDLVQNSLELDGFEFITKNFPEYTIPNLRELGNVLLSLDENVIGVLFAGTEKPNMLIIVGKAAQKRGLNAGKLIKDISKEFGIKGGGKANMGQAGGFTTENITAIIKKIKELVQSFSKS
ncbi:MAG: alanine--tRNA ligase [Candidatus Helarchaeota archaeon]